MWPRRVARAATGAAGAAPTVAILPGRIRWPRLRAASALAPATACAGAALPAVVSTIRGLAVGAVPNGDRGIIATRAYDVFTGHTPLVGQYSASTLVVHRPVHSLGPMLYWLLAVPARIGPAAMVVTMGAVSAACAAGIVLLARRRGGNALMFAVALAVVLMSRSLVPEVYHDIWNPSAGVMPVALAIFLGWSLACGEYRLLPLTVLVVSFAVQCELTYLPPASAALAVGLAGLLLWMRRERGRRVSTWRWWLAGAAVLAVCWSAPLVDQLSAARGNLGLVAHAAVANHATLGPAAGWHAVVRAVGWPPWWLTSPATPFDRAAQVVARPSAAAAASATVVLWGLFVCALVGWRRRRPDVAAAAILALLLCAALAAVAASTPTRRILEQSLGYTMWWASPAGMFAWVVLGWSVVTLLPAPRRVPLARVARWALAAGAAAALAGGTAVAVAGRSDQDRPEYRPIHTLVSDVLTALPPAVHTVRIGGSPSWVAFDFKGALIYAMRRHGLRPLTLNGTRRLGSFYEARGRGADATVSVWDRRPPRRAGRVVVRIPLQSSATGTISVTLAGPSP